MAHFAVQTRIVQGQPMHTGSRAVRRIPYTPQRVEQQPTARAVGPTPQAPCCTALTAVRHRLNTQNLAIRPPPELILSGAQHFSPLSLFAWCKQGFFCAAGPAAHQTRGAAAGPTAPGHLASLDTACPIVAHTTSDFSGPSRGVKRLLRGLVPPAAGAAGILRARLVSGRPARAGSTIAQKPHCLPDGHDSLLRTPRIPASQRPVPPA
jgi:hypothetical protein